MEDNNRFSQSLVKAIHDHRVDGWHIVEISRLILLADYTDAEYAEGFFSTFNLIVDEHRDGVSLNEIENLYKCSFIESLAEFKRYFAL